MLPTKRRAPRFWKGSPAKTKGSARDRSNTFGNDDLNGRASAAVAVAFRNAASRNAEADVGLRAEDDPVARLRFRREHGELSVRRDPRMHKEVDGMDDGVYHYVMDNDVARTFADKLEDMVKFLIPNYILEGKNQLVISIGCTGGKHRSVTLANVLYQMLEEQGNYGVRIEHRDIGKDTITKRK